MPLAYPDAAGKPEERTVTRAQQVFFPLRTCDKSAPHLQVGGELPTFDNF